MYLDQNNKATARSGRKEMVIIMRFTVKFEGKEIGSVLANHSMTDEEICEIADVKLMITHEDFENEDGYDLNDLEIVTE